MNIVTDPGAKAELNARESALDKALRLNMHGSIGHMGYSKPSSDIVLEDAEKFRKFLTGESA